MSAIPLAASEPVPRRSGRKTPVWMYDVDGVLVSLVSKRANTSLLDMLAQQLRQGDIVTFNSGRSPAAVTQLVLAPLARCLASQISLSRVMIVGEKGGAWATYNAGTLHIGYDEALRVPFELRSAVGELVKNPEFANVLEIERGKRTMVSVVRKQGVSLDDFQALQARFVPLAQWCLSALGFGLEWKIDVVSDAIEIEPRSAGKGKGAYRILHWLRDQCIRPARIVAIEDSPSGVSMAEVVHQEQIAVEFVFVSSVPLPLPVYPFSVVRPEKQYEEGTLEYLTHHYRVYHTRFAREEQYSWH